MNQLDATVTGQPGDLWLQTSGFRIPAPAYLSDRAGQTVTLGMRPEHLHDASMAAPDANCATIEATVDVAEQLGSEVLLHATSGTDTLLPRVDARTDARPGATVRLAIDTGPPLLLRQGLRPGDRTRGASGLDDASRTVSMTARQIYSSRSLAGMRVPSCGP